MLRGWRSRRGRTRRCGAFEMGRGEEKYNRSDALKACQESGGRSGELGAGIESREKREKKGRGMCSSRVSKGGLGVSPIMERRVGKRRDYRD